MSFVTNHDTDRNRDEYLGLQGRRTFILANEWLLAHGYGSPQVFSSFTWDADRRRLAAGQDRATSGLITNTDCSNGQWTCDHRNPGIVGHDRLARLRRQGQAGQLVPDEVNVIAFSKGNRGWAALNNGTAAKQIRVQTGLPEGTYCDVVTAASSGGACTGPGGR